MTTEISETLSVSFDDDEPEQTTLIHHSEYEIRMSEKEAILLANTILNQYYGV